MTIDEAIKLYKDLERINREEYKIFDRDGLNPKSALITAQRYEQLVEWLKDYKKLLGAIEDIKAEIQKLRGCSCSCSDGIIDDVEDIIDKHTSGKEEE